MSFSSAALHHGKAASFLTRGELAWVLRVQVPFRLAVAGNEPTIYNSAILPHFQLARETP